MRRSTVLPRTLVPFRLLSLTGAAAAVQILTGTIQAQTPFPIPTRAWDGPLGAAGTFNWADAVNWNGDVLPGTEDIATFGAPNAAIVIDLGAAEQEVGGLYLGTGAGSANYVFQNGTLVTNQITLNVDDGNAFNPTALIKSKNNGLDVLNVSVSSNTLQFQGLVTAGGINKFGGATLRFGTSGTAFTNAIDGDITIYGGTLQAAAGATAGVNNPLGGSGDIVIGAANVSISLTAQIASGDYDFERDVRAGNNNFTVTNNNASGTDPGDPNMRLGTLFIGDATVTSNSASGYRNAFDAINIATGSTSTRIQNNSLTFVDGLIGDSASNLYKRGGSDLEIRGNNDAFAGNIHIKEGTLRLLSPDGVQNPGTGSDSTIFFGGGFGSAGQDGGQLLQLRSNVAMDFGSNIAFAPGVTLGRLSVDRVATVTGVALSLGDANVSDATLLIQGGNSFSLALDSVTVNAGATGTLNTSSANTTVGSLNVGAGSTLIKSGGSTLTVSTNASTMLGSLEIRGGTVVGNATGALGSNQVTLGRTVTATTGILTETGILRWAAASTVARVGGPDVLVNRASQVDLDVTPGLDDIFQLEAGGIIQGNGTQFTGLTVGTNLIVAPDAVLGHETHAIASQISGLANDASLYYGLSSNVTSIMPTIGAGTPWKGISNDRNGRSILGTVPVDIAVDGGDENANTIELYLQGVNGQTLSFGSNSSNDSYSFSSVSGQRFTIAVRGVGGTSIGLTPGGNVALEDAAGTTGLLNVDKIYVQSGTLLLGTANALNGVPVEVQDGGAVDIRNGAAFDGDVTIKSGGVLFLNDNFQLTSTGVVTVENGGKFDITANGPANIFLSAQPINFTGSGHTIRFAPSNVTNLDSIVPDAGVTYVVAGGATAAILGQSNLNVTTNTQTDGITLENGILTNDATSRGFTGPINLNDSNLTVAASRNTSFGILSTIDTDGNLQIGSETAIDFRDKNANPERLNGLGFENPHDGHSQVLFLSSVTIGGDVDVKPGTRLGFADPLTNIGGDLIFNGTALYLDGGGDLNSGSATRGGLTPRLTSTSGLVADRVADTIILGKDSRVEMGLAFGANTSLTVTQPFVITGRVNPVDKRSLWIDRADSSGTPSVLLTDVLIKDGAEFGIDESGTAVRAILKMDGNATFVRNHDDYDIRDIVRGPNAPANVTVSMGQPASAWSDITNNFFNGSNSSLVTSIDGTVGSGVTLDLIRSTANIDRTAVIDGIIRSQNAPLNGDAHIVFRDIGGTSSTGATIGGAGEVQVGRSVAANGPEDVSILPAEVTAGPSAVLTVDVPVRVVNDGDNSNIDGIVRSGRQNDSTVVGNSVLSTLVVDAGAKVSLNSQLQVPLRVTNVNLGANSGIESTNNNSVFIGNVNAGTNPITFTGPAQARITGNLTSGAITATGAGLEFDPGAGMTSTVSSGDLALSGRLSVRTGTADMGSAIIQGAAVQTVAGLRENKTQNSFDEATVNFSNQIALGTDFAQFPTLSWGENQTVTYTGQINIPDNGTLGDGLGSVSFAKWFDDSIRIDIGGTQIMRNTVFNDGVATGEITLPTGYHDIEIRLGQGTGGAGAVLQDGNVFSLGLGIDLTDPVHPDTQGTVGAILNGIHYVAPVDNGTGSLFRTTTVKSSINLAANTALNAGGFTNIGTVTMTGTNAALNLAAAGASNAERLTVTGAFSGSLGVSNAAGSVVIEQATTLPVNSTLVKSGPGSLSLAGTNDIDGTLRVSAGAVTVDAEGILGTGTLDVDAGSLTVGASGSHGGNATLDGGALVVNGFIQGNVIVSGGTLSGTGTVAGGLTATEGGTIAPGNGGVLSVGALSLDSSATVVFELAGGAGVPVPGANYDQITTAGILDLGGTGGDANGAVLSLQFATAPQIGRIYTLLQNSGSDTDTGTFANLANGSLFTMGGYEFQISYFDDFSTGTFETALGAGSASVSILVTVPEPGSATVLAGAFGLLAGLRRFRRRG